MDRVLAAVSVLVCALLSACSSSDGTAEADAGAAGAAGSTDAGPHASCEQSDVLDLHGTFAAQLDLKLDLVSQAGGTATLCPDQQGNRASITMLVRASQPSGTPQLDSVEPVFCAIELPALTAMVGSCDPSANNLLTVDLLLSSELQQAIATLGVAPAAAKLGGLQPGASFESGRWLLNAGTRKTGDAMPAWLPEAPGCGVTDLALGRGAGCEADCVDDCAAMVDDDHDGKVGVTFHVCGYTKDDLQSGLQCNADNPSEAAIAIQGPLMMAFQLDPLLKGTAVSSCEVRGTVDAHVIYHVVGGDLYVENTQISVLSAMRSLPLFTVDAAQSRFRMMRVDGLHGAPDWKLEADGDRAKACSVVLQHRNELL